MAFVKNDCNKIGEIMTDKMKILKEFEAKTKNVSEYNDYHFFDFILDELIKARNELSKLHQPTVISAVCEHTKGSCKTIDGKHVMTCDDCHKIIWTQDVKKCDNIWCEDGKVNVYGNEWQSCPRCRDKQTDL